MSWRSLARGLYGPATVDHTVPPADIVPGFPADACPEVVFEGTARNIEAEYAARLDEATRVVDGVLQAERAKEPGLRSADRIDLCLEVRSALQPSAPGSEVLREAPPAAPLRAAVNGSYRWYAS